MQPFPHRERAPKLASAWLALAVALTACAPFNMPGNAPAEALPTAVESPALAKTATPNQAGPTQAAYPAAAQPSAYPASQATTEPSAIATAGEPTQSADDRVAQLPDPGGFTWQPLVSGLERVTAVVDAGEGRMLALEQVGRVRTIRNGQREATPFLDISDRVGSQGNEQGLLGIALHPDYATNRYFYVNYTNPNGATTIARFQASVDGSQADPASEKVLLTADQPYQNHNGGAMVFGPDGYLYLGLGDGGSAGDPQGNGQNPNTLLGAILRIDVDHADPYAIPADNPFADG
jgi:glucose/arabinose dehydrogenase